MTSVLGVRLGWSVVLTCCVSVSWAQVPVSRNPGGITGPAASQLRQEAFQVAVRNGQQRQILENLKNASPLTYYDSDWRPGVVKLANGKVLKADMRYNLLARALELHYPESAARPDTVLLLPYFQAAQLGTSQPALYRDFVAHPYQSEQSRRDYNLFEKINSVPGPVDLLLLHEVVTETTAAAFAPGGTGRPTEQNIQRVSRLYARTPKRATVQEISLSKTGILYLFGKDANRMADYATAHNLSYTDLAHVVQLVDQYNKTVNP